MPEIRNAAIRRFLEGQRARQMDFLAELVKVPSIIRPGTPPGTASVQPNCWKASASKSSATRFPSGSAAPTG